MKYNKKIDLFLDSLKFDKDSLIPAVVQDYKDKKVLMLAYMNKESIKLTIETGKVHYYSRSRQKIWLKGEQSKKYQIVKKIYIDCDNDCILIKIMQVGKASCHTGYRSCFYRELDKDLKYKIVEKKYFDPSKVYK